MCQQTPVDLIIPKLAPLWPIFIISPLPEAVWAEIFWVVLMTITCVSILACQRIPQNCEKHFIYPWTAATSAMQGGSSTTTTGHERREVFPACDEKVKEKNSHSLLFITETFSTVLPAQAEPLGHCHADTGVALQKHRKHRSFHALNVLKTGFGGFFWSDLQAGAMESGTLK